MSMALQYAEAYRESMVTFDFLLDSLAGREFKAVQNRTKGGLFSSRCPLYTTGFNGISKGVQPHRRDPLYPEGKDQQ